MPEQNQKHIIKFLAASLSFFFVGSMQGVAQLIPPVRAWLDSIGSPHAFPGHLIDPLAHAHINLIGGVMFLVMAVTYYLIPILTGKAVWSKNLMNFSFWGTATGVICFYSTLMIFGAWMGELMLANDPKFIEVKALYGPIVAISATIMGLGLWSFLLNGLMSLKQAYPKSS